MSDLGRALVGLLGAEVLTRSLARASDKEDHSGKSVKQRLKEIFPELSKRKDIKVMEGPASLTFRGSEDSLLSSILSAKPKYEIRASKKESTGALAHELGHILNDEMWGRPGRAVNLISRNASATLQPVTSVLSAISQPSLFPAALQLAVASPMLADEALASGRAVHKLVKTKGFKEGLSESLPLVPAFGSYLAHTAAPAIVTIVRVAK